MARVLEVKVVAVTDQAKRDLGSIDTAIKDVGTTAKSATSATDNFVTSITKIASGVGLERFAERATDALIDLGRQILADADALTKLSDKTGIGVEALQQLSAVADESGNSIDQITNAISMMQKRLAGGDKSAIAALQELNISLADLRQMSPDQQFLTIAKAIAEIQDPMERTRLAVEVFGRSGAEILPTIRANIDDIRNATFVMSSGSVSFWDAVGDAMGRTARNLKGLLGEFAAQAAMMSGAPIPGMAGGGNNRGALEEAQLRLNTERAIAQLHAANVATPLITPGVPDDLKAITTELDAQHDAMVKTEAAAKKLRDELERHAEAAHKVEAGFFGLHESVGVVDNSIVKFQKDLEHLEPALAKVENTAHIANFGFKGMADGLENVGTKVRDLGPDIEHQFVGPLQEGAKTATVSMKDSFAGLLKGPGGITDTFASAFEGGGGITGGLKSFATKAVSMVTSFIPIIGPIISKFAGPIIGVFSKLFGGVSEAEKKARAAIQDFEHQLASTLNASQKAEAAGRQWAMTTIAVRDAYLKTGHTAAEVDAVLKKLWDTKDPNAYKAAIEEINAVMDEQNQDQKRANELIEEYHISIEQLGPAFRAQELNAQAKQLMNDFRLMVDVLGIDAPVAIDLMKDKLNDFVKMAIRTGTEVPANMRPLLQQMIDLGLLTDVNGDKVTSLEASGITFAETFTQGVDRIVKKFDELIQRLYGVGDAIMKIPEQKDITIKTHYESDGSGPEMVSSGGYVGAHAMQYLAGGGRVMPFWLAKGTDTVPAMLTPGEGVLNRRAVRRIGGPNALTALNHGGGVGGGPVVNVHVNVDGYIDSPAAQKNLTRIVSDQMMRTIQRRAKAS